MGNQKAAFVCQNCGYTSIKWLGKCPSCNSWNTLLEETGSQSQGQHIWGNEPVALSQIKEKEQKRFTTGIAEFDRVLGGGTVEGDVILIGGEPGIGKSTLLLQAAAVASQKGKKVLYVSGEESLSQIKLRADRLKILSSSLSILCEVSLERIIKFIEETSPDWIVLDSIQTAYKNGINSSAGSVSQLRECASDLIQLAKKNSKALFLIGHVTKEGVIAGPRVLEHMVDVVLYFEGEKTGPFRILKTFKNRFGSTQEIGVFEMTERGLKEIPNPSEIFMSHSPSPAAGTVIASSIEGTRPLLVEIQALVSASMSINFPRRVITGVDYNRALLLLAVLEKTFGAPLHKYDLFINVVGGIKIEETAVDLPLIFAIVSSLKNKPLPQGALFVGEVGLSGEVRGVSNIKARIKEAEKLGFKKCILPDVNLSSLSAAEKAGGKIEYIGVKDIVSALKKFFNN
ncbi:MAG: DNA repair protein RadA [Candidatus Ratteibacteria bacterium]|nr:DNA repair protein RadA [Candidatus Ratteibacteria bacterium]